MQVLPQSHLQSHCRCPRRVDSACAITSNRSKRFPIKLSYFFKPITYIRSDSPAFFVSYLLKNKKCGYRSSRTKKQTPIVAKPTLQKRQVFAPTETEFAFFTKFFSVGA